MEILSVGKKIKRARIYKGYTLKELCGDKLSVSKLSCIENDKIQAEEEVLLYIAKKLGLDYDYLVQDIKKQITENIQECKKKADGYKYIEELNYNLEVAIECGYNDLAFEIIHSIFSWFVDKKNSKECHNYLTRYYELGTKIRDMRYLMFMDIGDFIYLNDEYVQALGYYETTLRYIQDNKIEDKDVYYSAMFKKANCLIFLNRIEEAFELISDMENGVDFVSDSYLRARALGIVGIVKYKQTKAIEETYPFILQGIEIAEKEPEKFATIVYCYMSLFHKVGCNELALIYCNKILEIESQLNHEQKISYIIFVLEVFMKNEMYNDILNICNSHIDQVIAADNNIFTEKMYYFKAKALEKCGEYRSAEIYYNLSLDILSKTGSKHDICHRYFEIGNMYYEMKNTVDAIKYLNFSMNIKDGL